jgi:plastocyanin
MRTFIPPVAVGLSLAGSPFTSALADVTGTTTAEGRAQPQSIVWIDAPAPASPVPAGKVVLDQRNLDFVPHVLVVRVGTVVDFPNHDRVFHNVFSFHDGKRFDLGLYPVGAVRRVRFDRAGVSRILCNIHPGMAAYVMAVETPYFAVSDASGRFTIPDVPVGIHAFHAWRPGRDEISGVVNVGSGASLDVRW